MNRWMASVGLFTLLLTLFVGAGHAANAPQRCVLIVTAVDNEFDAAKSILAEPRVSVTGGRQVAVGAFQGHCAVVIRSGWGKAQAAGATAFAIAKFHPSLVLFAGVGAGVNTERADSGDVVIVDSALQYDLGKRSAEGLEIWPPETPLETSYPETTFHFSPKLVDPALLAAKQLKLTPWTLRIGCPCKADGSVVEPCAAPAVRVGRASPRVCKGVAGTADQFLVDPAVSAKLGEGAERIRHRHGDRGGSRRSGQPWTSLFRHPGHRRHPRRLQ